MKRQITAVCGVALFVLAVCASCVLEVEPSRPPVYVRRPGPPPHAPAYGHRREFHYVYYPSSYVYFALDRRTYFYLEDGLWRVAVRLPAHIRVYAGEGVSLSLRSDTPYVEFDAHRRAYPPRGRYPHGPPPGRGRRR